MDRERAPAVIPIYSMIWRLGGAHRDLLAADTCAAPLSAAAFEQWQRRNGGRLGGRTRIPVRVYFRGFVRLWAVFLTDGKISPRAGIGRMARNARWGIAGRRCRRLRFRSRFNRR